MKNRSLYSVLTRFGIVAAVLTALLVIAPAAAQEADTGPCNDAGTECDYDENDTDPIATYSSADPEGQGIEWSVGGTDGADFDHRRAACWPSRSLPTSRLPPTGMRDEVQDNGVVTVTADAAGNNVYLVTVTATEMLTEGQKPPAESKSLDVQVTVKDVDEPGTITLNRLQPQVTVEPDGELHRSADRGTTDTGPRTGMGVDRTQGEQARSETTTLTGRADTTRSWATYTPSTRRMRMARTTRAISCV